MSAATPRRPGDIGLWTMCVCTAAVGLGAAYVSYLHGRAFALRFGADPTTAAIWPLIVDGLLTAATVELWRSTARPASVGGASAEPSTGGRWPAWLSFLFGIALSLCANIASAPHPLSVAVAASPPLALLLAVELLNRALKRHRAEGPSLGSVETAQGTAGHAAETERASGETSNKTRRFGGTSAETAETSSGTDGPDAETAGRPGTARPVALSAVGAGQPGPALHRPVSAEERMWEHFWQERAAGRTRPEPSWTAWPLQITTGGASCAGGAARG